MNRLRSAVVVVVGAIGVGAPGASADVATWSTPDLDSYTYAFVGQRSNASEPVFGQYNIPEFVGSFDNRDSQQQYAFDTASMGIPTGLPLDEYDVTSVTFTLTANTPVESPAYDPTYDAVGTYPLVGVTPDPDADAGRPITLFGAGFRNGYTGFEFTVDPGPPLFGPSGEGYGPSSFGQHVRHVYPIDFDESGVARDVSANLDEPNQGADAFDVNPFAIGATTTLTPGDTIVAGTVFTFSIDVADPDILDYVREGLADGVLGFVLATLHPASGGPGGGGGGAYPFFNLTENGTATPTLQIVYQIVPPPCPGDLDGDGDTDIFDFTVFAGNFGDTVEPGTNGDFDFDGDVDVLDFTPFAGDFGCVP